MSNTISQTTRDNIQRRLAVLIREMITQYALYENKHLAMLFHVRAEGLHYGLRIANGSYVPTFKLVHYIEDEARILKKENSLAFGNFDARHFVEEMDNLADTIVDLDD